MPEVDPSSFRRISPLRRVVKTACKVMREDYPEFQILLLTLTYADAEGWSPEHVKEYLNKLRQWTDQRGVRLRYLWVMELQERGAPHYHVLVWVPRGLFVPAPDQHHSHPRTGRVFEPMWRHGSSNVRRGIRHGAAYLAKYLSKIRSKVGEAVQYPTGARIYGLGGLIDRASVTTWARAPRWARLMIEPGDYCRKRRQTPFQPGAERMTSPRPGPDRIARIREFRDDRGYVRAWEPVRRPTLLLETASSRVSSTCSAVYVTFGGAVIGRPHKFAFDLYRDRLAGFFAFLLPPRAGPPETKRPEGAAQPEGPAAGLLRPAAG